MFADMVGYTALMQADEGTARALRDRLRTVLSDAVAQHQGQILQHYGDGTLSIFASAVEAVRCGVAVQAALQEEPRVPLRIGVHTGDVVYDGTGVYGHGVNVAARIEALADSGGIMISGKVYDEIKNQPNLPARGFGPVGLKNVDHPVSVFAVCATGLAVPTPEEFTARAQGASTRGPSPVGEGPWPNPGPPSSEDSGFGDVFLRQVRERAIIPWALVYLAGSWGFMQVVGFLSDQLAWPAWVQTGVGVLAFVGFLIAMVVAWHHGEKGRQEVNATEVVLISVLLLAGIGSLALVHARGQGRGVAEPVPADAGVRAQRPSVAVLPFDNFSPDPDDAYFADGVHEDITTALSRIGALRVPARSSVARFRNDRPSSQEIAAALGVDFLLEGSTTVVGDIARVTVQLIDGATDEHIWADEFDHEFSVDQLIAVRSAVARQVAIQLRALVTPEEGERIARAGTRDLLALELYQRARYRWNERTETSVQASLRLFQEALDRDSTFAEAHAGMADAYLVLANWGWMEHGTGHGRGVAAARRALELDPLNAGAHASLGALLFWSARNWEVSADHFRRSIELDPEYAYAHYWYSALLSTLGRHREAVGEARIADRLDPLSPQVAYGVSRALFLSREYDEAVREIHASLSLFPDYGPLLAQLCRCRTMLGEFGAAEEACSREKEVSGVGRTLSMALVRAFQGDREGALEEMEGIRALQGGEEFQPVFVAMVYAGLGEADSALDRLEYALEGDYPYLEYLSSNPFFDPLRQDPRFQDLLRRVGLGG